MAWPPGKQDRISPDGGTPCMAPRCKRRLAELPWVQTTLDKTERDNVVANERITKLKREISEATAANAQMRADNAAQASTLHMQVRWPAGLPAFV